MFFFCVFCFSVSYFLISFFVGDTSKKQLLVVRLSLFGSELEIAFVFLLAPSAAHCLSTMSASLPMLGKAVSGYSPIVNGL